MKAQGTTRGLLRALRVLRRHSQKKRLGYQTDTDRPAGGPQECGRVVYFQADVGGEGRAGSAA